MQEELRDIIREAKAKGLVAVVWSYPRGGKITKDGETALDIVAYAAHMAALMGAAHHQGEAAQGRRRPGRGQEGLREGRGADGDLAERSRTSCRRLRRPAHGRVLRRRGQGHRRLLEEIRQIRDGGGYGSIIGRNTFQRPKAQALELLDEAIKIYLGQA